jgi:hypothetical protein
VRDCPPNSRQYNVLGHAEEDAVRSFAILVLALTMIAPAHGQDAANNGMERKLAPAQQYVALTGREKRVERGFAGNLKLSFDGCTDDACRVALNQAVEAAVNESAPDHEKATVKLFATRLTEDELHAAISFAQSPQGKAILAAQDEMSGDLAKIARTLATRGFDSVRRSFCAAQPDACRRVFARAAVQPSGRP